MNNEENATRKQTSAEIIGDSPGGVHLLTIRTALKQGHAAVMIGSGFSLNAKGGNRLPTWAKLIEGLLEDVYPDGSAREEARARFGGTSGMLRLAEEYVAVRGRATLDARLHQLLPDAGIVLPGDVQAKLLALNWTDVFTTNYDTLLERTLDADRSSLLPSIKSRYQVVVAAQDVPYSKRDRRPRIIKLHGSLRSGSKLIVTEADYRQYPRDYAPFVNTVQQSMLENVFVLIGFSGDDPNFLAWTGWVRDHLQEKAPPLYLITFRQVPEGQRILLETRKIYPISIAELGKQKGESDYGRALSKLLDFWKEDPPIRRVDWPYESTAHLWLPMRADVTHLVEWLTETQRNRANYPGWIIAPADCRQRASDLSMPEFAVEAYDAIRSSLPMWLRLVFLDEVIWLTDITLNPLPERMVELIADEFADAIPQDSEVRRPALPETAEKLMFDSKKLPLLRANLAFVLLRRAREASDELAFLKWQERFAEGIFGKLSVEHQCALLYERILFKLEKRAKADALSLVHELDNLALRAQDTYWPIRVGALFGELGHLHKAFDCVREGLRSIREAIQFDGEHVGLVSREQWAEWLYSTLGEAVKAAESLPRSENGTKWSPEPGLRAEIKMQQGNGFEHSRGASGAGEQDASNQSEENKERVERDETARDSIEHPTSIMDEVRSGVHEAERLLHASSISLDAVEIPGSGLIPGLPANAKASALRYIRLIERVSLPPVMGGVGYSARTVASCFRILATSGGQTASLRLLLRASDGLGGSLDVLDLATVSALEHSVAENVFEHAIKAIGSIAVDTEWDSQGAAALKALMDLTSRLAFRLEAGHAEELCEVGIKLHHSRALQRDYSLHMMYSSFFRRAVRLLSRTRLRTFIPRILALVMVESDALAVRHIWPNPLGLVGAPSSDVEDKTALATLADEILARLSVVKDASERARYLGVIDWLYKANLLTPLQTRLFAQQLWLGVASDAPPLLTGFYQYAFLTWPTIAGRPSRHELFKRWVSQLDFPDIVREEEMLGRKQKFALLPNDQLISMLTYGSIITPPVRWSEVQLLPLVSKIKAWWAHEGTTLVGKITENSYSDEAEVLMLGRRLRGISYFCLRVLNSNLTLSAIQTEKLDSWFAELWEASVLIDLPVPALLFVGLHWWPDRADAVLDRIIGILESSSVGDVTADALQMAVEWTCAHEKPTAETRRFMQYLVDGVRSGPDFLVEQKLKAVRDLLLQASASHTHLYLTTLGNSLCSLLDDLRSGAASRSRRVNFYATPLLRVAVSKTLMALKKHAHDSASNATWLVAEELVRTDPLLLVRNQQE